MSISFEKTNYDFHKQKMNEHIKSSIYGCDNFINYKKVINKIKFFELSFDSNNLFIVLMLSFFIFIGFIGTNPIGTFIFLFLTVFYYICAFHYLEIYRKEIKKQIIKHALSYIESYTKEEVEIFFKELQKYKNKDSETLFNRIEKDILNNQKSEVLNDKKIQNTLTFEEEISILKNSNNTKK